MSGIEHIDHVDKPAENRQNCVENIECDDAKLIDECEPADNSLIFDYDSINCFVGSLVFTVLREIEERSAWLEEMHALGHGKTYKNQIMNEIAERLRLIKEIERRVKQ